MDVVAADRRRRDGKLELNRIDSVADKCVSRVEKDMEETHSYGQSAKCRRQSAKEHGQHCDGEPVRKHVPVDAV